MAERKNVNFSVVLQKALKAELKLCACARFGHIFIGLAFCRSACYFVGGVLRRALLLTVGG